ncbi:MAG: efflux RND transporter permease subunit [Bacteroidales bacterium]|nr:efflux RND transporter permease subunit [Bacteroidales bacterium]
MKRTGSIEWAMRHRNVILIITGALIIAGIIALLIMPRNEYPQFTIRQGLIVGVYPGATSSEVEEQLTKKVENYIFSFKEIKKSKTYSYSKDGIMYIFVELNDNVKNADQFWSKLKHGLDELKMSLPPGVIALIANSDFGDTAALLITLSSDKRSYRELEEQLEKLEAEIRKLPATSKMRRYGLQREKIYIHIQPEKLNEYKIKTLGLLGTYQTNGLVSYAGKLKDSILYLPIHLPANFNSERDLAEQIVYTDPKGNVVRLKDISKIERRYEEADNYIKQNGMKTILLSLEMQPGNNIVEYGKQVDEALKRFQKSCPSDIKVAKISELPKYVQDSVNNFLKEFFIAIAAVILVTMILLPLRVASVAGITIPISVFITLSILYMIGIELHTVSLASLILVLGMIVDNSIVVIDNHVEKIDTGISPWHAAIKSAEQLFAPIVTATLAIMVSYIPLAYLVPGTAGEFLETMPIVISVALSVSILVAVFLVPYLNFIFIKRGIRKQNDESFLNRLQVWFDNSLEKAFNHKRLVVGGGAIFVALAIAWFTSIDQQLFPELERNQFAIEVYLPTGSSLESTETVMDSVEKILLSDKRVVNVTAFIGTSSPRFHAAYAPNMPASNYGQFVVNTVSDKATRQIVNEYGEKLMNHFANAHVKFKILALQLNKAPIEIRISSDTIEHIRKVQREVEQVLEKTPHIAWYRNDWEDKQQYVTVNIDKDRSNRLGLSRSLIATSIMVGTDGIPLTTIWEDDYPVEVVLKQDAKELKSTSKLENQYITSPYSFEAVPLRSIANLTPSWEEGNIVHRNGTRTLTIFIDNDGKKAASRIFETIRPQIENIKLPEGTKITYGGDYEAQVEVFNPMVVALIISIGLIFLILLFEFKKEKTALLIMSSMALTLPGAVLGLKLMGYPFSVTAFVGISSLCGMVVRNGIILIDYIRELRDKQQMPVKDAALAAGKRRMRPIFLTSAAASVGVIPMIISRSPLWGPLGTVICFGLLISMILVLYMLPIMYTYIYSDKPKKQRFWSIPVRPILLFVLFFAVSPSLLGQGRTLTVDSCKKLALQNNWEVKRMSMELEAARQVKKEAFTTYFPKISAGAVAQKFDDYLIKTQIPQMNLPVYDGNPANLQRPSQFAYFPGMPLQLLDYMNFGYVLAVQPVFTGGRIINGNKLASTAYNISEDKLKNTQIEVMVKAEELFWQNISLQKKMATIDRFIQLLDTLYRDATAAYKAGMVNKTDLLKIQLKQNELKVNRLKLIHGITLSREALLQHIGLPIDTNINLYYDSIIVENPNQYEVDREVAIKDRNEYRMLENAVKAQQLQKRIITGEYLPQISVGAAGLYTDIENKTATRGLVFATVSIPISDWWGGSHKIRQYRAKEAETRFQLLQTSEMLKLQIKKAYDELTENYFQVQTAMQSVSMATENLRITRDNYKAGVVSVSELLEAQAEQQKALDSLTEAQCNFQIAKIRYLQTINRYQ